MNREWAINKLRSFLEIASITYVPDAPNIFGFWHDKLDRPKAEVQAATQVTEQILDRVLPEWRTLIGRRVRSSRTGGSERQRTGPFPSWKLSKS